MTLIRVLRVLEYIGTPDAIYKTLSKGGVPYNGEYSTGTLTIKSAVLGLPELMPFTIPKNEPCVDEGCPHYGTDHVHPTK